MDLIFETPGGRVFSVEVWFFATVLEIKEAIQKLHGFPVERQTLVFHGRIMEDSKNTVDYGLLQGSRIILFLDPPSESPHERPAERAEQPSFPPQSSLPPRRPSPPPPPEERLRVTVLTRCGTIKIIIYVNSRDNVGELKKELMRLEERQIVRLPPEGFFFVFKHSVMYEELSFFWHGVRNGDTIEIFNGTGIQ